MPSAPLRLKNIENHLGSLYLILLYKSVLRLVDMNSKPPYLLLPLLFLFKNDPKVNPQQVDNITCQEGQPSQIIGVRKW